MVQDSILTGVVIVCVVAAETSVAIEVTPIVEILVIAALAAVTQDRSAVPVVAVALEAAEVHVVAAEALAVAAVAEAVAAPVWAAGDNHVNRNF